ncbi:copper resistance CopC family protein, partial [Streptomyces sp. URMC 128]|uniref:copper resistance CopC family protein n=1 Tax=Streptomyces sp. URMC 128 TaxID=3423404 RepID=UPI003F1D0E79
MTTTVRRALLLLLLTPLLYILAGAPQAAFAHTELVSSSPKDGADLKKAPGHLTLTFDEAVDLDDIRVLTVDGDRLPVSRSPRGGADAVRVALPAKEHGKLAVTWSVVDAEDGHASSGRIAFTIGAPAAKAGGGEAGAPVPAPS